jgi:Na+/H+ antiporter NhaC
MDSEKKLEFYGGEWMSFLPIVLFIILIVVTSFAWGSTSDGACWVPAIISLMLPFFFAKDKKMYADTIIDGLASKDTAVPIACWIFAGVFARVLRESGFADGLAGLAGKVGVNPLIFTVVTFLCAVLFSTATGTGFGTIAMGMGVLYPAGVALGVNPALLAGVVLSGAAFGDNMAPVSDTLICSTTSVGADLTKCVKSRFKYAITSGSLTLVAIIIFCLFLDKSSGTSVEVPTNNLALIMFVPMILTLVIAIKAGNIIVATTIGTVVSVITALAFGLVDFIQIDAGDTAKSALITVYGESVDRTVGGILYNGISGMVQVIILCLLLFAMINIMKRGEGDKKLLESFSGIVKGPVSAEVVISVLVLVLSALLSLTAPAILLVGPSFGKPYAEKYGISPCRMANIMSGHSVTLAYCMPWTATMMLTLGFANSAGTPLSALEVTPMMFYAYISIIVLFATTFLKIGRNDGLDK